MPLTKLTSNVTPNTDLYNQLSSYKKIEEKDLKLAKLTLFNDEGDSVYIDLADIFIFNMLVVNDNKRTSSDVEKTSYKATSAYHLHSLIVYLSQRFPNMVLNTPEEIYATLRHILTDIINLRHADLIGEEDSHFFVEECNDDQYLNIVCNTDYFLKIDTLEERILFMCKGKVALLTFYFF